MTTLEPSTQVDDVREGDRKKLFSEVFDAHYDFVYHSLRRLGVQSRDLEDLAHDTFVKVYENLSRYDKTRPLRPWLFAFAFRVASDYRRLSRHKTMLGADADANPESGPNVEDTVATREVVKLAEKALLAIPLEQRAVFVMYEIDETPMKTIAEVLEIPVNTAYSRLRLARETFAEIARQARAATAAEEGDAS